MVAGGSTRFAYHAQIQFLLDKLEEVDHPLLFGRLAGTLSRLALLADVTGVVDIERVVPLGQDPQNPFHVCKRWEKEYYGSKIANRLRLLTRKEIRNEDEERVMPHVAHQWGVNE